MDFFKGFFGNLALGGGVGKWGWRGVGEALERGCGRVGKGAGEG